MGIDADVQLANSVSTQLGGRPTIVFSDDVSLTRQHSIRGTPLKKKGQGLGLDTGLGLAHLPVSVLGTTCCGEGIY